LNILVPGLVVLVVALLLLTATLVSSRRAKRNKSLFVARQIMTDNEIEFFTRLEKALPEYRIFSQVAMSGILDTTLPKDHHSYWSIRNLFDRKRIDYVLCTKDLKKIVAVIELDDRTHESKYDQDEKRDKMLACAGIRTVRFPSTHRPSPAKIRDKVIGSRHPAA